MKTLNWGILGCGDVTEKKSGPAFNLISGSRLFAVMRRDAAKAADYARRHGVDRWYDDADALIQDPDVNAVYIATPPGAHASLALKVATAGKPCYVEKPMSRSHAEALEMNRVFDQAGQQLFVAYYRRALPRFEKIRELLTQGSLGELREIRYEQRSTIHRQLSQDSLPWRFQPELSGGGLFIDLGSHTLDLLDHWLGPLSFLRSELRELSGHPGVEDFVDMHFVSSSGVPGRASWNFSDEMALDRLELRTQLGRLQCSIFGQDDLEWHPERGAMIPYHIPHPDPIQLPLIREVVSALLHGTTCCSTGSSALRTRNLMDRALHRIA
ncbi:MAG: Gfo/Idh/MocA family oxidoreductase [Blastochloris sp.]|nr:Gfo/Idh/MocA family oxidoreductase [Blastochloris sp.]